MALKVAVQQSKYKTQFKQQTTAEYAAEQKTDITDIFWWMKSNKQTNKTMISNNKCYSGTLQNVIGKLDYKLLVVHENALWI